MIVDQHQPVVEKYYGSGKMSSVIECLLDECDRVVKKLLDGWEEDRGVKRKVRVNSFCGYMLLKYRDSGSFLTYRVLFSRIQYRPPRDGQLIRVISWMRTFWTLARSTKP